VWPTAGAIHVDRLTVRYRPDLPPVLKGLTFRIASHEKVGICGRTGCGKSTLMLALYRLVEPSSGSIKIDGIEVTGIGLYDLRSRLSLVPQDPVIFTGSLRTNLAPFGDATDRAMWEALRQAGLEATVRGFEARLVRFAATATCCCLTYGSAFVGHVRHRLLRWTVPVLRTRARLTLRAAVVQKGLDSPLDEGGTNLSVGQRQLLCMARALLKKSTILLMDEATSNVDNDTDSLIQRTIRSAFTECTVLTIAHRLHTIIDSDKILLLDQGTAAEFDAPKALLRRRGSKFRALVQEAGSGEGGAGDELKLSSSAAELANELMQDQGDGDLVQV
jgi:ABC-type multidrug transport system fused ATPase/permease subunit